MLIGIDIGTQSLKVVVTDEGLKVHGEASVQYAPSYPQPGWAEQDTNLWLNALKPAIAAALEAAKCKPSDISGLAICGQLDGCVGVDRLGNAMGPAIIWMDKRAANSLEGIDTKIIGERTGIVLDASHMAAKIKWCLENLASATDCAAWHQPTSFMVEKLTGRRVIDPCLASTSMVYGLHSQAWDANLLRLFGIEESTLPPIAPTTSIAGYVSGVGAAISGLPIGLPVAVGTGDDFSTLLGCGVSEPGTVCITIGTGEIIGALADKLVIDADQLVETHIFSTGHYHLGNPGWLSGGAIRWFLNTFSIKDDAEFSALAAQAPPGCDGLLFIPALTGATAPQWVAKARGTFHGMTTAHTKSHFARAILEGTAFAMRDVVDRLTALGVPTEKIRIMGGGSKSQVWMRIRADLMGRKIEVLDHGDATALGAAAIAAVAVGSYPDLQQAVAALKIPVTVVEPDAANYGIYDQAYRNYLMLFAALLPLQK
ncbi:MAG: FGGY family carbohydrate kinase [Aestuariivirga sp.]